jgi:hypothetical protein
VKSGDEPSLSSVRAQPPPVCSQMRDTEQEKKIPESMTAQVFLLSPEQAQKTERVSFNGYPLGYCRETKSLPGLRLFVSGEEQLWVSPVFRPSKNQLTSDMGAPC